MVEFHALFEGQKDQVVVTRTYNGTTDESIIPSPEITELHKKSQQFNWTQTTSQEIGEHLFTILNGETHILDAALKEADNHGEPLQLFIKSSVPDLPYELLYKSQFLVPLKVHVIRHVSDFGCKKKVEPENRPLKVLFMACSPEGIEPVNLYSSLPITPTIQIVIYTFYAIIPMKDYLLKNQGCRSITSSTK